MITAFVAVDGRSVGTHAALLAAFGMGIAAKRPATLIRVTGRDDAPLPIQGTMPDAIRIVEHPCTTAEAALVDEVVLAAHQEGHIIVLDLPAAFLANDAWRGSTALLPIIPVGPTLLDEHLSMACLRDMARGRTDRGQNNADGPSASIPASQGAGNQSPPWLLGCGRPGGGPAVAGFRSSMRDAAANQDGRDVPANAVQPEVRVVPITLPNLSRAEAASLIAGRPMTSLLRPGLLLAAALRAAAAAPHAPSVDPARFATSIGSGDRTLVTRDDRDAAERLRDLADALQAIHDGTGPTPVELAEAPVLNDWRMAPRVVRSLVGRSDGHPDFPSGRAVTTSEVYATDGRTYARTFSRLYRLGAPARDEAESSLH